MEGYLGCFHILAIWSYAAVSIEYNYLLEKEGRKGGKEGEKEEEWKEFFDV
jgi:hypothetical protein